MADPVTLGALAGAALYKSIDFLYAQAGEVLERRRERQDVAAESLPIVDTAALEHPLQSVTLDPRIVDEVADELVRLRQVLAPVVRREQPIDRDHGLLRSADALRRDLQAILGQQIVFRGERAEGGPRLAIKQEIGENSGYAAGLAGVVPAAADVSVAQRVDVSRPGATSVAADLSRDSGS